jgi:large subunit ribosomal protein L23
MKILSDFIIKPVISEKSYAEAKEDKYTFVIARDATKTDVKNAVEKLFGVTVKSVFTANIRGTKVRNTRKGRYTINNSYKKARVLILKGQKINIFEEAEEKEKKANKK